MSLQVNALLAKGEYFFVFRANVSHDIAVFLVSRAGHHGAAFSFTSRSFACEPACGSALHTKNSPLLPRYKVPEISHDEKSYLKSHKCNEGRGDMFCGQERLPSGWPEAENFWTQR